MSWNFRSLGEDLTDPERRDYHRELGRTMWRASKTRDGKLILAEALLFVIAGGVEIALLADLVKTGSWKSAGLFALLFLLTFWPFLRHRLRHGDWPQ